ncbi:hypothetical protein AB0O28_10955 [Microbispora sp. NPDC088329]|uniref:hypothetical protein n=1 Tax=Microbispora sp. NPDC088329 TaxID=3154869 RepID=UPI0034140D05
MTSAPRPPAGSTTGGLGCAVVAALVLLATIVYGCGASARDNQSAPAPGRTWFSPEPSSGESPPDRGGNGIGAPAGAPTGAPTGVPTMADADQAGDEPDESQDPPAPRRKPRHTARHTARHTPRREHHDTDPADSKVVHGVRPGGFCGDPGAVGVAGNGRTYVCRDGHWRR